MANSSIDLVPLDFDSYKASLIQFLQSQDQFKDYNFEASNINVLLDILSYNTYKNSFYLNMAFAESFIDSAQLKESLFSHAKELNYVPRSARSSVANISLSFSASGESQPYTIAKGETFTTLIKQNSYTFTSAEDIIISSPNTTFTSTFNIYEGYYVNESYLFDSNIPSQKFMINNENVDLDSLTVSVYEDGSSVPINYIRSSTLLDLTEKSEVYFVQGSLDARYEILFGDGIIGRKPKNNSLIVLQYRVTAGGDANGAKVFSANFDPTGAGELLSAVNVTVNPFTTSSNVNAQGYSVNGDAPESLESIRYYAPRHFQTQERAVTVSDYQTVLKTKFPEIGAITVYGGEELSPPRYGKVFVAVDIKNVEGLPDAKKTEYYSYLKSRSPLSIDPIFTEPAFTYVAVNSKIKYNKNITTQTIQNIEANVVSTVTTFANTYLNDFNSSLRYSKLVTDIDKSDTSIISNQTDLVVYKKLNPKLGTPQNLEINFNIPLKETYYVLDKISTVKSAHQTEEVHTVYSSLFTYNGEKCELEDNGNGVVRIIRKTDLSHVVLKNIGTVDYEKGIVKLNNFTLDSYDGNYLKLYVETKEKDIISSKNEILSIEPDEINVTVEAVRE